MNELQVFENSEFGTVRTIEINNEPWFVGKDVCDVFGDTNYRRSLARLEEDERVCHKVDTLGGKQDLTVINESGLYSLLFYMQPQKAKGVSQNDNAINERVEKLKKFKRWVTSEVLPSIRKHGMYATDELLNNPDLLISVATALKSEREKNIQLTTTIAVNNQIISELKPKADYMDDILNNKGLVTITQIAKDYGMTGGEMNALLHDKGVQYKQSGQWLLYNKHAKQGYTHSETVPITHSDGRPDIKMNTKWTQKGRLFLYNLLKSNEVLPSIEQQRA